MTRRVLTLAEIRARYAVLSCGWDGAHPIAEGGTSCSCGRVTRHPALRPAVTERENPRGLQDDEPPPRPPRNPDPRMIDRRNYP